MMESPSTDPSKLPLTEDQKNVRPLTTTEEDRHSLGQRRVNLIWECTQAVIAVSVTGFTLYTSAWLIIHNKDAQAAELLLSNAFFLVIGFYFGRTNHQRIGGVELGR